MISIFQRISEMIKKGEEFAVATIIKSNGSAPRDVGTKMIVKKDKSVYGTIGGGCIENAIVFESLEALKERKPRLTSHTLDETKKGGIGMLCGGTVDVFVEVIIPKPKLLIIGSGYIARSLVKLGKMIGFSVVVIDPWAKKEEFLEADEVISEDLSTLPSKITSQTYIVIVTRHKYDEPALNAALNSKATYIGMVGSKNRVSVIFQKLIDQGVPKEKLQQIYAPIGLPIDAETPEEIAISIIGEIICHRRGNAEKLLKFRGISSTL
jgi:xanthine dehydrogenase accessory factor